MRFGKTIICLLFISAIIFIGAPLSFHDYQSPVHLEISIADIEILDIEMETTVVLITAMFKTVFHMAVLYLIALKRMPIFSAEGMRMLIYSVVGILKKRILLTPVTFQSKFRGMTPLLL